MSSYKDLINSIKQEMGGQDNNGTATSIQKEASYFDKTSSTVSTENILSDLEIDLVPKQIVHEASVGLEKIAQQIDKANSMEELIKIAEQSGNNDVANLIKLSETKKEDIN